MKWCVRNTLQYIHPIFITLVWNWSVGNSRRLCCPISREMLGRRKRHGYFWTLLAILQTNSHKKTMMPVPNVGIYSSVAVWGRRCFDVWFVPEYRTSLQLPSSLGSGWPLVPKLAGSNPAEAVWFFRAKKSSARLPSRGSRCAACKRSLK
jgi:hypothetical protein